MRRFISIGAVVLSVMVYYGFTSSTILSGRILFGILQGVPVSLVMIAFCFLVETAHRAMVRRWSKARAITGKISQLLWIGSAVIWLVVAYIDSRPGAMFRRYWGIEPSCFSKLGVDGTLGIDGSLWIFSGNASPSCKSLLLSAPYTQDIDVKDVEYWKARFRSRVNADWELGDAYEMFSWHSNGVERLVFTCRASERIHLVYCTFPSGF